MQWPPMNFLRWKMAEHSAWYGGDPQILANTYSRITSINISGLNKVLDYNLFWARQVKNNCEIGLHVPIAADISSLSADLLFSEPPSIKIAEAHEQKASQVYKDSQEVLNQMFDDSGFYRKILECGETCSAMGGGYIKLSWDSEISPYPIPVVEQVDNAIPEFKFGVLTEVTFWSIVCGDGTEKVHRLLETYHRDGSITYKLYFGTSSNLGKEMDLKSLDETADYQDITTNVPDLLVVYIPNMLPNRLDRNSNCGRSDYSGIEGLMDSLDETYSAWMRDVTIAQGKIMIPQEYLSKSEDGTFRYNMDRLVYTKLDVDPVSEDSKITPIQFDIRANDFNTTCLNLLDRIISSAGYSPQSMGLQIEGLAQSGTALNVRERKSFITKNKKESYWEPAIKRITKLMILVYKLELEGIIEADVDITTSFSDSLSNDISETSSALQQISAAMAASTEVKVRMLHTDWSEDEIEAEVQKIKDENALNPVINPDAVGFNNGGGSNANS